VLVVVAAVVVAVDLVGWVVVEAPVVVAVDLVGWVVVVALQSDPPSGQLVVVVVVYAPVVEVDPTPTDAGNGAVVEGDSGGLPGEPDDPEAASNPKVTPPADSRSPAMMAPRVRPLGRCRGGGGLPLPEGGGVEPPS